MRNHPVLRLAALFSASVLVSCGGAVPGELSDDEIGASACDSTTVPQPSTCPGDVFTPDRPTERWRRTSTRLFVVTQGSPRHRCVDMIYNPGQDQTLVGKFTYGAADKDLKGEDVEIWLRLACGSWVKVGRSQTSDDGQFGTVAGIEDDGGRIFFTVPPASRPGPGTYAVKMLVKGDHTEANCSLSVWPAGTRAIVSDIDGTITTQEIDGFTSIFDPSSPRPHRSAPETFQAWASKGWKVIYLTARPEFLTNGTRAWFAANRFPPGVFHLSQSNLGESGQGAIDYKGGWLAEIAGAQGVVLDAAYGNRDTDLAAYQRAGLPPGEIRLFGLDGGVRIDDYTPEASRVGCLVPVGP